MKKWMLLIALLAVNPVVHAKQRTVIEELPKEIVDNSHVVGVEVVVADTAKVNLEKIETKATEKRKTAGLTPYDPANASRPAKDEYATLPIQTMLPLVMQDVTREWGLTDDKGTPIKLRITIETVKTANAAMAMLLSSSDELAGKVDIFNAQDEQSLGSFYVHVVNAHGGWGGMLMRGGGIREKLAEEFSLESARILTGSTKKDWKKRVKAREKVEIASKAAASTQ